jgi:hypothetical protein
MTKLIIGFLLLLVLIPARAQMLLSDVVADFDDSTPRTKDIEVTNNGKETLYLEVTTYAIGHPELEPSVRQEMKDPCTAGLLATPNRMMIPVGQRKILRLLVKEPAKEKDLIYRVAVVPKTGKLVAKGDTAIKIMVGYEILAIVRPPNGKPDLKVKRSGRRLDFVNNGNSSILIREMKQCNQDKSNCTEIPGNRLYAGENWHVQLPMDGPVESYEVIGLNNTVNVY